MCVRILLIVFMANISPPSRPGKPCPNLDQSESKDLGWRQFHPYDLLVTQNDIPGDIWSWHHILLLTWLWLEEKFTRTSFRSMKYLPLHRCLTEKKRTFLKQRNTWRRSRRRLPVLTIIPTRLSPFWKISTSPQFIGGTKLFCLKRPFSILHKVKQVPRKPDHTFM